MALVLAILGMALVIPGVEAGHTSPQPIEGSVGMEESTSFYVFPVHDSCTNRVVLETDMSVITSIEPHNFTLSPDENAKIVVTGYSGEPIETEGVIHATYTCDDSDSFSIQSTDEVDVEADLDPVGTEETNEGSGDISFNVSPDVSKPSGLDVEAYYFGVNLYWDSDPGAVYNVSVSGQWANVSENELDVSVEPFTTVDIGVRAYENGVLTDPATATVDVPFMGYDESPGNTPGNPMYSVDTTWDQLIVELNKAMASVGLVDKEQVLDLMCKKLKERQLELELVGPGSEYSDQLNESITSWKDKIIEYGGGS